MKILGLTGTSGSGKSYVARLFEKHGIPSLDFDKLVHQLYAQDGACTQALAAQFGKEILDSTGAIDRVRLGGMVFSDPHKLSLLNQTVFPFIAEQYETVRRSYETAGYRGLLLDAPTLFESGLDRSCDCLIAVIADHKEKVKRIMARDKLTEEEAIRRLSNQHSDDFFRKHCQYVIDNTENDNPEKQVIDVLKKEGLWPHE